MFELKHEQPDKAFAILSAGNHATQARPNRSTLVVSPTLPLAISRRLSGISRK